MCSMDVTALRATFDDDYESYRVLGMEHVCELDGKGNAWVVIPIGAAYKHGWITGDHEVTRHVVEVDHATVTLLLPLDELS